MNQISFQFVQSGHLNLEASALICAPVCRINSPLVLFIGVDRLSFDDDHMYVTFGKGAKQGFRPGV